MSDEMMINAIADAIRTSSTDFPAGETPGTRRDAVHVTEEESRHFARAAIRGLSKAGFIVTRADGLHLSWHKD